MNKNDELEEKSKYLEKLLKIGKEYSIKAAKDKKLDEKIKKLSSY